MKKYVYEFCHRGLIACGMGPIVLAVLYIILKHHAAVETLTVNQVCIGIFSLIALAFIAGGINVIYQLEQLPLMVAILIHGCVLYICYLATYLLNDWLKWGLTPILVFTGIFIVGYLVIWAIIFSFVRRKTERLNEVLKKKQHN